MPGLEAGSAAGWGKNRSTSRQVGRERIARLHEGLSALKRYLVDTVGTILFFTTVAALSELFVAGMEPRQVLIARLIMIPVMMLTGRPYGVWRDWVFTALRPRGWLAALACDIGAFLTFQVPVYVATLAVAGAGVAEITAAVGSAIVFMVLLSRPFGLYLDVLRRWAGTSAA